MARVVPLFKKNDKTSVGNTFLYLSYVLYQKSLKRVVYDQVSTYLSDDKLLYEFQSGLRSGFSIDTCLIHLTDFIRTETDKGNIVSMILLDLQKAFDTVYHSILHMKL